MSTVVLSYCMTTLIMYTLAGANSCSSKESVTNRDQVLCFRGMISLFSGGRGKFDVGNNFLYISVARYIVLVL